MDTVFLIIFAVLILAGIGLRYRWTFGDKSLKELSKYVRKSSSPDTLASFICSDPRSGNVGLLLSRERILCRNQDSIVFDIHPEDLQSVEYSNHNFFRFITKHKVYKISYLHAVKEGESFINNILMAPNLAYTDKKATRDLLNTLDMLRVAHVNVSHTQAVFLPFQGSRAVLGLMALTILVYLIFVLINS